MSSFALNQLIYSNPHSSNLHPSSPHLRAHSLLSATGGVHHKRYFGISIRNFTAIPKSSSGNGGIVASVDDPEDGVLLGTLKLPGNTDLVRFETLLFQF
ncbi:hypothetical protein LINPERHAP2_LOCUS12720 [Linum perenne]